MYTGSGGKDLKTKNRRTGEQTFDQELTKANLALAATCDAPVLIPSRIKKPDVVLMLARSPKAAVSQETGETRKESASSEAIS